jgi:general secretion pathway protein G
MSNVSKYLVFGIGMMVLVVALIVYPNVTVVSDLKVDVANQDIHSISKYLEIYYRDHGQYPSTDEGLEILVPKYFKNLPPDPWGESYLYSSTGSEYVITHSQFSKGKSD